MSRRGENIYKRKDGRWEGRYIKGRKEDGTIHYGYIYRKSYRAVRTDLLPLKLKYQQLQQETGTYSGTVTQWLQEWLAVELKETVKESTFASYQHKLQKYVVPSVGSYSLNELSADALQQMITRLVQQKLASSTIHVVFQIVQKAIRTAVSKGYLLSDRCLQIELPKMVKRKIGALTKQDQAKLEAAAVKDDRGFPALLALHTGMRMGEVAALRWSDIDLVNQVIHVSKTYQRIPAGFGSIRTKLLLSDAKTSTSQRTIPFTAELKKQLVDWQGTHSGEFLFMKNQRPMEPRLLTYHFRKFIQKWNIKRIHFHQLRHTFATRCLEAKGDIASISALLGHSSAKMTLDVYVSALIEQRRQTITEMESSLHI